MAVQTHYLGSFIPNYFPTVQVIAIYKIQSENLKNLDICQVLDREVGAMKSKSSLNELN